MDIVEILKAVLFGIVEGVTEWLPISSTGHMILLNEFVKLRVSDAFYSMFEVVIQLGAILAVVVLFWNQIWPFGKKNNREPLAKSGVGAYVKWDIFKLWFHILVSCVPAAIVGILFDSVFEAWFYNYQTVAIMLILFGIAFIVIENQHKGKKARVTSIEEIDYRLAFWIGIFQLIAAIFPGTSPFRSHDCRSIAFGSIQNRCRRIHILPGNSGYVWCQSAKGSKVFDRVLSGSRRRNHSCGRYGCGICSIYVGD